MKEKNIQAQYNEFMTTEIVYKAKEMPAIKL